MKKLTKADKAYFLIIAIMGVLLMWTLITSVIQAKKYENLEELRPCPFCGSTNVTYDEWSDGIEMHNQVQDYDIATVHCEDCNAEIKTFWHESDNAKNRWNSRK